MTVWNDEQRAQELAHSHWMANTAVLMHLNERATGDPARDWLSSWAHRWFVGDALRVLVLGCGEGWLERAVAQWPFVAHIDAVDVAEEAVARAREAARHVPNIRYGVVDLDRDELPRDAYDVIVAHSVLHHVTNLDHAYAQLGRALRAEGTLLFNEYVGPNRFQYGDDVLSIINALLACLGRPAKARPSVEEMIANDPTEAVRSEELLAFTESHFDVLERKNIGGTILQHLLYETIRDFRFDVPRERAIVEILCTIEAMLVDAGRIPCDYVILAARKRGVHVTRADRPLPPRPAAARDVERDPLWRWSRGLWAARRRSVAPARGAAQGAAVRLLRLALLAGRTKRANLYRQSRILSFLARRGDAWERALRATPDPAIQCLLRTAATLASD